MFGARIRFVILATTLVACASGEPGSADRADAERRVFAAHDAIVAAMLAGSPVTGSSGRSSGSPLATPEWQGVNLNGTPMSAAGFEGEDRTMVYDRIEVLDRHVRVYGDAATLQWHANFWVKVNGRPSFAEMRLLDVFVLRDGRWLNDLTQATPVYGTVGNPPEGRTESGEAAEVTGADA